MNSTLAVRRRERQFIRVLVECISCAIQGVSRVCGCVPLDCGMRLPVIVVQNLGRVAMLERTLMHRWGCKVAMDEGSMKMRRLNHEEA